MKYAINNVYNELYGQYFQSIANYSTLGIIKNSKKWSAGITVFYPFIDSWKTGYETVENSIVYNTGNTHIYNNGNMLILSFSYNFDFGRKFKEQEKSINNSDSDPGVFDELKGR